MTALETNPLVHKLIMLALEEDLSFGDITSELTIPRGVRGVGKILAKQPLVVCGLPLVSVVMKCAGFPCEIEIIEQEGKVLAGKREVMGEVYAEIRHLLAAERTILNLLQRLSGVATHTKNIVEQAGAITVLDTRKTTPGFRVLEKYAVKIGGGKNHRHSLGDQILVKNNHIDCAGGIRAMIKKIVTHKPPYMPLEVEVRNMNELIEILSSGTPHVVMLDNMNDEQLKEAIAYIKVNRPSLMIEVSGGITTDRFDRLRSIGVESVSIGSLTTAAQNVDISFSISTLQ